MSKINQAYKPKFLSWAKTYNEEVEEFESIISGNPDDLRQLLDEYEELTGEEYKD